MANKYTKSELHVKEKVYTLLATATDMLSTGSWSAKSPFPTVIRPFMDKYCDMVLRLPETLALSFDERGQQAQDIINEMNAVRYVFEEIVRYSMLESKYFTIIKYYDILRNINSATSDTEKPGENFSKWLVEICVDSVAKMVKKGESSSFVGALLANIPLRMGRDKYYDFITRCLTAHDLLSETIRRDVDDTVTIDYFADRFDPSTRLTDTPLFPNISDSMDKLRAFCSMKDLCPVIDDAFDIYDALSVEIEDMLEFANRLHSGVAVLVMLLLMDTKRTESLMNECRNDVARIAEVRSDASRLADLSAEFNSIVIDTKIVGQNTHSQNMAEDLFDFNYAILYMLGMYKIKEDFFPERIDCFDNALHLLGVKARPAPQSRDSKQIVDAVIKHVKETSARLPNPLAKRLRALFFADIPVWIPRREVEDILETSIFAITDDGEKLAVQDMVGDVLEEYGLKDNLGEDDDDDL